MKGVNPAWANLPRRKCDDCGKTYKPKQPLRPDTRGFCSDNCRKSYHKHGGAYRKLRTEVEKLVLRELARRMRLEEPCEVCGGSGTVPHGDGFRRPGNLLLPKQPYDTCPKCFGGSVLTPFGRDVLDLVDRRSTTASPLPNRSAK